MVSHCDEQSLHNGPVFGCPWEDMASRAKTATVAAALIRTAALEAIAVQWSGWMLESNRNINTKSQIKEGTSRLVPIYGAVGDAIYRASSVGIRVFSDNGKNSSRL